MSNTSAVIYIVLAVAIGYAFAYPAYNEIFALMDEKNQYENMLATVKTIETKKADLQAQFEALPDQNIKDIDVLLPSSPSFVILIAQIDSVAAKYGISIANITSREDNQSMARSIEDSEPEKIYQTNSIGFAFTASYDNFRKFLNDLERSLRILDIKVVKIIPQDKGLNNYNVEFSTYWYK